MLAACGGTENAFVADDGSSSEGDLGKSVAAATYTIGKSNVKDWYLCGQEGSSTCRAGDGGRYMAFGANGQFVFNDLPAGPVRAWSRVASCPVSAGMLFLGRRVRLKRHLARTDWC